MDDRLAYRIPEAAKMLGISVATFHRRVETGDIKVHKLGGITLIKRETLEKLVDGLESHRSVDEPPARPPTLRKIK